MDIPSLPATGPERLVHIGKLNHIGAQRFRESILADKPATPFHFVLARFLEKLQEENGVLVFKVDATIPQIAWAVRNLLELWVLARFVCRSQTNLDRFQNDIAIISTSTQQAQLRLVNDLAREVNQPTASEEIYRNLGEASEAREAAGLGQEGPLMARTCAKKVGLEKEYLAFSSVTSALVHPSAISILKTFDLEVYRDLLVPSGLILGTRIIEEGRIHVDKYGFRPAP
jgi:hypothetical protein